MKTATQRCPGCGANNDVSIFVSGQRVRCVACDLPFIVRRSDDLPPRDDRAKARPRRKPVPAPAVPKRQVVKQRPAIHPHPAVLQQEANLKAKPKPPQQQVNQEQNKVRKADTKPGGEQLVIPGFELFEVIGKGGMGKVFRARQISLNRTVAIKVLNEDLAKHKSFIRRFEKETASLAAMSHPNISAIIDRGHQANVWYFVMEYIDGPSLRQKINAGKMDMLSLLDMFAVLCSAVAHAHRRGVIHRDLKPENVLFTRDGVLKVVDFGLANILDDQRRWELTRTKVSMGTVNYMAPEQRRDAKHVDQRADIYSLGVMLYELLAGELPLGRFDPPSKHRPEVSSRLDKLVLKMLDFEADRRPQEAGLILATLEKVQQEYAQLGPSATVQQKQQPDPKDSNDAEKGSEASHAEPEKAQPHSSQPLAPRSPVLPRRHKRRRLGLLALLVAVVGLAATTAVIFWGMLSSDLSSSEGDLLINTGKDGPAITLVFPQQIKHLPPTSSAGGGTKVMFDFKSSRLPTIPVRLTRGAWSWDEREGVLVQDTCLKGLTINQLPAVASFGQQRAVQDLRLVVGVTLERSVVKLSEEDAPMDMQSLLSKRFSKADKIALVDSTDRVGLGLVNDKGEGIQVMVPLGKDTGKVLRAGAHLEAGSQDFPMDGLPELLGAKHELSLELHDGRIVFQVDNRQLLDSLAGLPMGFKGAPAIACQNARCGFDYVSFSIGDSVQP